ncbi:HAD family phosphatase [Nisaea acidiphila]|uniref:HAD family phosphatase n=1 Tax=Nisaea acidiphila TaxID=1862145 RepID=A0A9J7AZH4_9PROT|nr:HAD family phosphatase [Nisaea acidiphila]UUX51652.1 HAD family phosphatase [Nisaea acidiphila]
MSTIDAVLFDVGNVLLEWNPRHLYRQVFRTSDGAPDEERIEWFLANICTTPWHVRHDLGRSPEDQTAELVARHPEHKAEIEAFYGRFQEMIPGPLEDIVAAKAAMKAAGRRIYGLTNFGAETFRDTRERFPFLKAFDDVVVSGEEGVIKPDPRIFELCVERFGLAPERTLFIDDSERNIEAARALGFEVHHFEGPDGCLDRLKRDGLIR